MAAVFYNYTTFPQAEATLLRENLGLKVSIPA